MSAGATLSISDGSNVEELGLISRWVFASEVAADDANEIQILVFADGRQERSSYIPGIEPPVRLVDGFLEGSYATGGGFSIPQSEVVKVLDYKTGEPFDVGDWLPGHPGHSESEARS